MAAGEELVQVAWANDRVEAGLIQGLLESAGIPSMPQQVGIDGPQLGHAFLNPTGGSYRVMVDAGRAEEARALLAEALVEEEREAPEPVNARYLEEARGRGPRNYGPIGAYARIYFWSFVAMATACGVFMLLRAV
jgi:hypothetical protein